MRYYLLFVFVCACFDGGVRSFNLNATADAIQAQGYYTETHYVTTYDGYILQVNRIPYRRYQNSSDDPDRPVVFLMHGLLSASNSFIALGYENSIAYNLADAGCDVWMGNARGNSFSRSHVSLNPDDNRDKFKFFDFSWEEIGMIDVPAMIDYALDHTGKDKLHYIGHSQGGTVFLVMGSMRPEYNEKLASVHLLAGVGYMKHFPNSDMAGLAVLTDVIYGVAVGLGFVELFPPDSTALVADTRSSGQSRTADACVGSLEYSYMCELMGMPHLMNDVPADDLESIFEHLGAAGASLKQIAHYGQNIRDKAFRRWNYGLLKNLEVYRSIYPPAYNLNLITSDIIMHYTINDDLLDERDVIAMAADIPNARVRKVPRDDFLHEDFVVAGDAKVLVTDSIIEEILAVSANKANVAKAIGDTDNGMDGVLRGINTFIDEIQPSEYTGSASSILLSTTLSLYLMFYSLFLV